MVHILYLKLPEAKLKLRQKEQTNTPIFFTAAKPRNVFFITTDGSLFMNSDTEEGGKSINFLFILIGICCLKTNKTA